MGNILKFWATFYFNICSHWQVLTKLAFWWKTHSFLFHYYSRWNFTLIRHNNINPNHAMSLLPSAMKQSKLVKRYLNRDWIYLHNLIQFLMDQSRPLFLYFLSFQQKTNVQNKLYSNHGRWCRKQPFCQPNHNHCQPFNLKWGQH